MKIIFFGTSEFAADILRLIFAKCSVAAVVTQPDRKKGRDLRISAPPVKAEAEKLGLLVFQPANPNEEQFTEKIKGFNADFLVVASFGTLLGADLLKAAKLEPLNVHPSLLPKYRGAAPIHRAVMNGEKITGVTIMRMDVRLDAGDIIMSKKAEIEEHDNSETLSKKLAALGADLLIESMWLVESGGVRFEKQDEKEATFASKLKKEDGIIRWDLPVKAILNQIRALKPWPGTYSSLNGRILKITEAKAAEGIGLSGFSPGDVIMADEKKGLIVKANDGAVSLLKMQIEGKKEMAAELFLRGHKIKIGTRLGLEDRY